MQVNTRSKTLKLDKRERRLINEAIHLMYAIRDTAPAVARPDLKEVAEAASLAMNHVVLELVIGEPKPELTAVG